jgi:predicted DNA-binding transcriptional regulator YafY
MISTHIVRCVRLLAMLSSGQALSTAEMVERLSLLPDVKQVSLRQIQRDLRSLEDAGIPLHSKRDGTRVLWFIPQHARITAPLAVQHHELLSLHMLKGALGAFRGTRIEADVDRLLRKLERVAPGTVYLDEDLTSDVSPGRYATAISEEAMNAIVNAIVDPHWDRVTYRSLNAATTKTYVVSFCRLINHAGRLYVAAWHPVYQRYITLAADRIEHVERANDVHLTLHVFNERAYRSGRFGVYDGDVATVKLRIDASAAEFFTSRLWHPSQVFRTRKNGSVDLEMTTALSPELVSWIVSWADVLTIISPKRLKTMCQAKVERLLDMPSA